MRKSLTSISSAIGNLSCGCQPCASNVKPAHKVPSKIEHQQNHMPQNKEEISCARGSPLTCLQVFVCRQQRLCITHLPQAHRSRVIERERKIEREKERDRKREREREMSSLVNDGQLRRSCQLRDRNREGNRERERER